MHSVGIRLHSCDNSADTLSKVLFGAQGAECIETHLLDRSVRLCLDPNGWAIKVKRGWPTSNSIRVRTLPRTFIRVYLYSYVSGVVLVGYETARTSFEYRTRDELARAIVRAIDSVVATQQLAAAPSTPTPVVPGTRATTVHVAPTTSVPVAQATSVPVAQATSVPVAQATSVPIAPATDVSVAQATDVSVAQATNVPVAQATDVPVAQAASEPEFGSREWRQRIRIARYLSNIVSMVDAFEREVSDTPRDRAAIAALRDYVVKRCDVMLA